MCDVFCLFFLLVFYQKCNKLTIIILKLWNKILIWEAGKNILSWGTENVQKNNILGHLFSKEFSQWMWCTTCTRNPFTLTSKIDQNCKILKSMLHPYSKTALENSLMNLNLLKQKIWHLPRNMLTIFSSTCFVINVMF